MELLPWYISGFFAVLLLTAFVKILTTLSILRYGIGLNGFGFGIVVVALSLGLSLLVMAPELQSAGGIDAVLRGNDNAVAVEEKFTPFLKKHSDPELLNRFGVVVDDLAKAPGLESDKNVDSVEEGQKKIATKASFPVLVSAFLVSELREAFQIGFLILLPFLLIDFLVVNVLMAVGITQISQAVVALPLKVLLFLAVDGWALITEKLVRTYIG